MQGRILTFYFGDTVFGADITRVKEINRNIDFTPVPGSIPAVLGLLNLRGQIVSLIDVKSMLEVKSPANRTPLCMVLKPGRNSTDLAGLLIDRTGDVLDVEEHLCETAPSNYQGYGAYLISEVFKQQECLIPLLDIEALFQLVEDDIARAAGINAVKGE